MKITSLYSRVSIYLYLEDDSIHVSEPRTANSGIPQGTLIRRHKIVNPNALKTGQHYMIRDLNVECEVTFYGKTFKIISCDDFTRVFQINISFTFRIFLQSFQLMCQRI